MIDVIKPIAIVNNELALKPFYEVGTNRQSGYTRHKLNLPMAQLVSTINDIMHDPMVTAKTTMKELHKLYPQLKARAKVLWDGNKPNWDIEKPLALIGVCIWRDSPRARTLKLHVGKQILEFKC